MRDLARIISCHSETTTKKDKNRVNGKRLTIALAGNANVGKSVIFNQLTGSHQTIGNWPGMLKEASPKLKVLRLLILSFV